MLMLFILNFFIIAVKKIFCNLFFTKIYDCSPHFFINDKEKKQKKFYNNLGIRAVIIYFCSVLIDLINNYKNHKIVCIIAFMKIFV